MQDNHERDNHENRHPFDGREDQTPLMPELEALESRLMLDAAQWDAESPDLGTLATYALALANDPSSAAPVTDGKVVSSPAPAPRVTPRLRLQPLTPRQPSTWTAYIVTLGIVATMALVLLRPLLLPHTSTVDNPTPTASMTAAATDTPLSTGTPTSPTKTPGGAGAGFTVQSIRTASVIFDTDNSASPGLATETGAPIPTATGGCGPHVIFYVTFAINLSNNPNQQVGPTALISYYFRNSDGSSDGSAAHPVYTMIPSGGTAMTISTSWQMPYTQANGALQWTELDIVQPNQISYKANFKVLCTFSLYEPIVSASPTSYNCATGGDQTFTLTGTLKPTFTLDNTSHTVTYFWEYDYSTHATTTPSQTVTFPPGATSMSIQPETVIGNAATQTASFQAFLYVNYAAWQYHSSVTVTSAC